MRLLLVFMAAVAVLLTACGDDDSNAEPTPAPGQTLGDAFTPGPTGQSLESEIITFETDVGEVTIEVEVADSPGERGLGLMHRESLGADEGMLFIWPEDSNSGFWMENTLIPLTVAFIRADGTVVGFADMEPLTMELHYSPEPFRYGVEANQGWFADNGVEVGDTVDLGGVAAG